MGPVKAVLTDDIILVEQNGQWLESQQASSVSIYDEAGKRNLQTPFRVSLSGGYAFTQHESLFDPQKKGREVEEQIANRADKWVNVYDAKGYVTSRTRLDSNGKPVEKSQITYEYDARGNWIKRKMVKSLPQPHEASHRHIVYFDSGSESVVNTPSQSTQANVKDLKNRIAPTEVDIDAGRLLFNQKCIACHGENGKSQTEFSAVLAHKPKDLTGAEVRALTDDDIFSVISNGKKIHGMPALTGRIGDRSIWQITLYVKRLSSSPAPGSPTTLAAGSTTASPQPTSSTPLIEERKYPFKGKVVFIQSETQEVTVEHDEIPGYMGAMTMPFPLKDEKVLGKLKKDDRIQATLVVDSKGWRLENVVIK